MEQNSTITSTSSFSNKNSFSFGSHQSFPLRYGWIEKVCFGLMQEYGNKPFKKEELKPENLSQNYGIGSNMAKSLRFWLKACGITNDNPNSKDNPYFTKFAFKIFGPEGEDRYLEKKETIWRLHFNIINNFKYASTWSWFFNHFLKQNFDRQQLLSELIQVASLTNKNISEGNIKRDIDCFVRSYVTNSQQVSSVEDALDCPLIELNLIRKGFGNTLLAKRDNHSGIPDDLFLLSIHNLRKNLEISAKTITVESLLNSPYSPGCNFLLSRECLLEKLEKINEISQNSIELDQSSGLAQIIIKDDNYCSLFQSNEISLKDVA